MNHETIEKVVTVFSLLVALGLQAACASDIDGGSPGTGSTLARRSGGAGGAELSTVEMPRPCIASETILPPADGLIADFNDPDGGMDVGGVRIAYPLESPSAPTYTTTGGSLHITVATPATSVGQYLGVVVGFPNRSCVDARAFTGVQFSIRGSVSGCVLRFYANDDAHQDSMTGARFASGPTGARPPQAKITSDQVTPIPRILRMPFIDQSDGSPATPIDPSKLIFLGWQFDVDASTSSTPRSCIADLTIDDVRFFTRH